ncbi:erythromycin esterase family protein [Halovivax limisalsi]|uniref:erythromycin esterase family protein n=1 Tax=Halovivax limisalsi TaxID=1453760 RepID=UPI001FFCC8F6|nr:erythromycin esterase family protein [Halovivax limisalsi]
MTAPRTEPSAASTESGASATDGGAIESGTSATDDEVTETIRSETSVLEGPTALAGLADRLREYDLVLLGEASHGTSEFYRWRSWLTARLLQSRRRAYVCVEGDWADCYAVNRYVKGLDGAESARDVLDGFDRWPTWLWANWEVVDFAEWLASHNESREAGERAGFYGLDVYGLFESMRALIDALERIDPDAAEDARRAYRCFEPYGEDAREYAQAIRLAPESCEDEVVDALASLTEDGGEYGDSHPDERFSAEQNALVAKNAEAYYRSMVGGGADSWNTRDRHMAETLDRLQEHHGEDALGIVWAHNTHVGDARATDMERRGRLNLGQLAREELAGDVALVGFGSHRGEVVAGERWDAPMERMPVPPARRGSIEERFHRADGRDRLLVTDDLPSDSVFDEERGHRAIGVVYDPDRESGNYVPTVLAERYDAYVHVDETTALHPLARHADRTGVPELYPWGL